MEYVKNIGLMGNPFRPMAGLDAVYGYDIAVNEMLKALMMYGRAEELVCIMEPKQYQEDVIRRKHRNLVRNHKTKINLSFYYEQEAPEKKIDVLHNMGMEFVPQLYYRNIIASDPMPVTYTIHGASYPDYIQSLYLLKLLLPFKPYDSLICTSRAVRDAVKNMLDGVGDDLRRAGQADLSYNGRLDIIPLGVDTNLFSPMDKASAKAECGLPVDRFIILWLGRLSAMDKADLLPVLVMFKRLLKENVRNKPLLVLAGNDRKTMPFLPSIRQYMESLGIQDEVVILDQFPVVKRNRLMSAADVFLSPVDNIQETFGITPIEAMACGTPQIVSDWDGYKDTVVHQTTGFRVPTIWAKWDTDICRAGVFPSEPVRRNALHHLLSAQSVSVDLDYMQKAIQLLIDNPGLWAKMSEASVIHARRHFSWKVIISSYEELWQELKEIRGHTPVDYNDTKKLAFLKPRYSSAFSTYPTRFVQPEDELLVTQEGNGLLTGDHPLPQCYDTDKNRDELPVSLEILRFLKICAKDVPVQRLMIHFSTKEESLVMRSVMWLIKHGFVRLISQVAFEWGEEYEH